MTDKKDDTLAQGIDTSIKHTKISDDLTVNEGVRKMGDELKPDVPTGLAVIPQGAKASALARHTTGELPPNKMEYHCPACGKSCTLEFDEDEMLALDNNIRDYTGPCPSCGAMMLTPKDTYWGKDFPSMNQLANDGKRAEFRAQAEEFVSVVKDSIGEVLVPGIAGVPAPNNAPASDAGPTTEPDLSDLKPR
jgi:predicted RNA-binding Zn-ribbon protein involved in translation (DUF1610 family)